MFNHVQALNYTLPIYNTLNNITLQHSTIRFSTPIIAGSNFTGDSTETSYNAVQTVLPSACRVACEIETSDNSTARFEVWLPTKAAWNSRFLAVGNGGWAGGINYPDIVTGLKEGFATMSTNTSHNSTQNDASWTGNAEEMIDFSSGHRALHLSTIAAKEVVETVYNLNASYSYYSGCSTGGHQGWNEVQRYPEDFDGVLVGAPAIWMTHLPGWDIRVALEQFPNAKPSYIPSTMWAVIHEAVVSQCDALDGVVDGLVSDPSRCNFHPEVLACGNGISNSSQCLNPAQISNLHQIYTPWWAANNTLIFDGLSHGGEAGYTFLFNSETPQFGIDFFRHAVLNDTAWDYITINGSTIELADAINPGGINAYDPDLRPFQAGGGRVIEYHGYQDPVIPSLSSGTWYDKVYGFYCDLGQASQLSDFYRLFMVPGMRHCSGGDGAWVTGSASQSGYTPAENSTEYSLLYSLINWVENKNSSGPQKLIGTKYVGDVVSAGINFTRPYCRWPNIPVYDGVGDVSLAESWSCPTAGVY
ncbi:tannase and feruloyl esterase [Mollisia scopiformis]|uniref:Carboxylic ester hydrolase n=1 Tax=Mollisia scopiformis TaxID=149040 RepID=A0A194WW68_MOLSC|nr:tannase and feruloyl esterase [Mollisia scopiformis]KUJ12218.1 tannase and feruloyl esterase [Mollisia scopiformis]